MSNASTAGEALLFSPHLDDAALSASTRIADASLRVITVFAGAPPAGIGLSDYDRLTRASSSRERHLERMSEDDRAMGILGCAFERLDELDDQYLTAPRDLDRLVERLLPLVAGAREVWLPAAVGSHPDHVSVRDAALRAVHSSDHDPVVHFYADLPYSIVYGWPSWVTGVANDEHLDVDVWLEQELAACGLKAGVLEPTVTELTPEQRARKERAIRSYRTQLAELRVLPDVSPGTWEALLGYEVGWRRKG